MKVFEKSIFYFILFFLILAYLFYYNNIDLDYWAILLSGENFLNFGHVFATDSFSFVNTHPWVDHEWGSGVVFFFIQKYFGYVGILVLFSLVLFFAMFFMIQTINLQENKSSKLYNIVFFFFIIHALDTVFKVGIRCQVFTFMFFALFLYLLELVRKQNKNKLLILLPFLMVIWANLHGGSVAGLGLILLYAIGEALNKKSFVKYLITFLVAGLAIFINPYGLEYIKFLFMATTLDRLMVAEWQSPFLDRVLLALLKFKIYFVCSVLLMIFSLIKIKIKKENFDFTKWLILFVVTYLSFRYIKHIGLFVVTTATFLYYDFYFVVNSILKRLRQIFGITSETFVRNFVIVKEVFIYSFLLLAICSLLSNYQSFPQKLLTKYPIKAVEFMKINELSGNILTPLGLGSYVSYKLYPQNLVSVDGRFEEVFFENDILNCINFYSNDQANTTILNNEYNVKYVLIEKDREVFKTMLKNEDFSIIYQDEKFVIFARKNQLKDKYKEVTKYEEYYKKTLFDKLITFQKK